MLDQLSTATPLMRQYFQIKNDYQDTLVFFQVGDFYELFFTDAQIGAEFLGITLTKRGKHNGLDIPLCGIPCHMLMHHLSKLVKGGFKVAVCDQTSKPKPGTIVTRAISRVYTPGTLTDDFMLEQNRPSYVLSLGRADMSLGLIFAEILTSELFATQLQFVSPKSIESELLRFEPDEVVMPPFPGHKDFQAYFKAIGLFVSIVERESNDRLFSKRLDDAAEQHEAVKNSLSTLCNYFSGHNREVIEQAQGLTFYTPNSFLAMDVGTIKTLEVLKNTQDGSTKNTLFSTLNASATAAGSRTLVKWLARPLVEVDKIIARQDFVGALVKAPSALFALEQHLKAMPDFERIVGRIVLSRARVADFLNLCKALSLIPKIKDILRVLGVTLAGNIFARLESLPALVKILENAFDPENSTDSDPIKLGFDPELDRLKNLVSNTQSLIFAMEQREIEKTGIESLKIRYNEISGYSIEITKTHVGKVPEHYKHQQSLAGKTRFYTQELKALEQEIAIAKESIESYSQEVFSKIKATVFAYCTQLKRNASSLAVLDALYGLASVAYSRRYVKPEINDNFDYNVIGGRHPVVERSVEFVPNDLCLNSQDPIWLITGPNMGGKSTFLRQCAQISIMAQIGSFVPAQEARLGVVDKIFTRIGSGDNLAAGKSTFLVEMEEVANICSNATSKSFLILDEVGRGTGTYDGISIAHALLEFIRDELGSKCLFATHYQELSVLEKTGRIKNFHTKVQRENNDLIFFHKVEPGVSPGSFGVDVARMAGLPERVVARARELLSKAE